MRLGRNVASYSEGFRIESLCQVRVDSTYSSKKKNTAISEGNTLSVTLCALKINAIPFVKLSDIFASLLVDGILVAGVHEPHNRLEVKPQATVDQIIKWRDSYRLSV